MLFWLSCFPANTTPEQSAREIFHLPCGEVLFGNAVITDLYLDDIQERVAKRVGSTVNKYPTRQTKKGINNTEDQINLANNDLIRFRIQSCKITDPAIASGIRKRTSAEV